MLLLELDMEGGRISFDNDSAVVVSLVKDITVLLALLNPILADFLVDHGLPKAINNSKYTMLDAKSMRLAMKRFIGFWADKFHSIY
jgi:hypothetical protein